MKQIASPRPLAIAHRGAHRDFPENSLPAILRAIDLGAQGIEIDVRATSDGVLVLHHDPDLTDGRPVAEVTALDVTRRELAPGIRIPRLEEILEAVAGRAILFIETKVAGIELPLIRAVRSNRADSAIHSFHHETIQNIKKTMPAIRAGILTSGRAPSALAAAIATRADDIWREIADVDATLVVECHRLGKQVIAWTANTRAESSRLEALGVDGICTDDLLLVSAVAV